jgi:predicted dehydrogenase
MQRRKALLVGAGNMGRTWGRNLAACEDVTIAGWIDVRLEAATEAVAALGLSDVYVGADLENAIGATRADFVVDVTVPESHCDVTLTALRHGLPVLGEKPMADNMARAREMVAAADRAGQLYMVSQSRRYNAGLQALHRLIVDEIGPLGMLNSDFYLGAHFGGFRDHMSSPLILDMAIHTLDAARYLSDADPVAVYCEEFNPPWSWYRGNASATAIFEMSGGLRYTYRGSWCSEGRPTSWESDWRAVGPRGTAIWDGEGAPAAGIVVSTDGFMSSTRPETPQVDTTIPTGIAGSLRDFLHALETGATPMGECHDNIKSLAMVFAAIESAATGRRIAIEL